MEKINLDAGFASIDEHWSPRLAGVVNNMAVKLVKFDGEFVWHHHDAEDELFMVIRGRLRMKLRDEEDIVVGPGEFVIVPHGVEHCPVAEEECEVVLLEPATTVNTGNLRNERTVTDLGRITAA